jgi:hypothetical protein
MPVETYGRLRLIIPAGMSDIVGLKAYNLCRVKTIRIAVSTVMDDRLDLRDSQEMFCFNQKGCFRKEFSKR